MNLPGLLPIKPASTVLFLGAGASEFAGYQTFRSFGDLILNPVLRDRERLPEMATETPRWIEEIRTALERMQRPTTHDNYLWLLTDYHNFCGKFDTHTGLQARFPNISDHVHAFDSQATTVINDLTRTTFCHYSRQRDAGVVGEEVRSLYEQLAIRNDATYPFLPIFTTNYDLLMEDLWKTADGVSLFNGIPGRTRKGAKWTPKAYDDNIGINLYRLHGCIAWFNDSEGQPGTSTSFNRAEGIDGHLLNRLCVMFPGRELERGKDPHGSGFKLFFSSLLRCRTVVFIGFSFRDDDVMQVLLAANALREKPLKLMMIDPRIGPAEVIRNLEGAARRSVFHVRLPKENEIGYLCMKFGQPGLKELILNFLDSGGGS